MDSGGPHKAGEAVVVELDAPDTAVDLPILGKLCWQTELEGEFSIGCSLMRIEDFEQLRRLGNKPRNKPRKKLSPYLRAAMCVFVLFVSSMTCWTRKLPFSVQLTILCVSLPIGRNVVIACHQNS